MPNWENGIIQSSRKHHGNCKGYFGTAPYNFLCGGRALEHIEYRRRDPTHLDMLGTHSIPDPTTAGDFCRRYSTPQIDTLQDEINRARLKVWAP